MIKNMKEAKEWVSKMRKSFKSPLSFSDTVAKGYLSIYKVFDDGTTETVLKNDPNVIMYAARRHHLAFLYDRNTQYDLLNAFKVGTGGAVGDDSGGNINVRVITPDPARSDLYSPITIPSTGITITPSDPINDPENVFINVQFTVNQDEGNGLGINECGIFKESGLIFNHKTFQTIQKTESFSLVFDWNIRYI